MAKKAANDYEYCGGGMFEEGDGKEVKHSNPKLKYTDVDQDTKDFASMLVDDEVKFDLTSMVKMDKEIKKTLVSCSINDIRFLVDSYYQMQDLRVNLGGKLRSIEQGKAQGAAHVSADGKAKAEVLQWLYNNMLGMENEIKKALDKWGDNNEVSRWAKQVMGIGPVISAGLVSYFDITKAPSVSHFYSFCGLNDNNDPWLGREKAKTLVMKYCQNPIVTNEELVQISNDPDCARSVAKLKRYAYDEKKDKYTREALIKGLAMPPFNTGLKVLLWKLGESFVKVSNKDKSLYGRIYKERKALETQRNEAGEFAEQAAEALRKKNYGKGTDAYAAYSVGKLPPAHIQARSKRYAIKLFVSHLFEEMWRVEYGTPAPRAYVFEHLGHVDVIEPEVPFTREV